MFKQDNGSMIFIDGDFMGQIHPNGSRMEGFKPSVEGIDETQRIITWKYAGKLASITVDLDRKGGVWMRNSGSRHRVAVVQAESKPTRSMISE